MLYTLYFIYKITCKGPMLYLFANNFISNNFTLYPPFNYFIIHSQLLNKFFIIYVRIKSDNCSRGRVVVYSCLEHS